MLVLHYQCVERTSTRKRTHTCTRTRTHTPTPTPTCMHVCTHTHKRMRMRTCTCTRTHVHAHTHTHTHIHARTRTYTYIHMFTNTPGTLSELESAHRIDKGLPHIRMRHARISHVRHMNESCLFSHASCMKESCLAYEGVMPGVRRSHAWRMFRCLLAKCEQGTATHMDSSGHA